MLAGKLGVSSMIAQGGVILVEEPEPRVCACVAPYLVSWGSPGTPCLLFCRLWVTGSWCHSQCPGVPCSLEHPEHHGQCPSAGPPGCTGLCLGPPPHLDSRNLPGKAGSCGPERGWVSSAGLSK